MVRLNPFKKEPETTTSTPVQPLAPPNPPPAQPAPVEQPPADVEEPGNVRQVIVERVIDLGVLNEKLNYIIQVLNEFKTE